MYQEKDFSSLLGIEGFSDTLLQNHFKLYAGYVKNVNALLEQFPTLEKGTPAYNELSRRFGWEFNGMRLHELYFENMSKTPGSFVEDGVFGNAMSRSFGSTSVCGQDFEKRAMVRGIGWVVMYYDSVADTLFNVWIDEHGTNHLTGCAPLLVMDMWEHAYMTDYQLDKAAYVAAFGKAIDWSVVQRRFEAVARPIA